MKFLASSFIDVTSSEPAASSVNADTLVWDYVNLYPRDTSIIFVHGTIQPPPAVNLGDTLTSYAFILREDVVGSYDPNDKNESHAGLLTAGQVNTGDFLQYTIRFQNTGSDTAFNIYVRDTLQNTLDWNSFEMVASSQPYSLVVDKGVCLWSFNNIRLADSTTNEPASQGYAVYRIKPKAGLIAGNRSIT